MAKKSYNLQFDPRIVERVDALARRDGKSRQQWMADALEARLEEVEAAPGRTEPRADPSPEPEETYECPVPRCDFRALSPRARCAWHNRAVRPAERERYPDP